MTTEYKVVSDWRCMSSSHKSRKIEMRLNELARDGWEFAGLDSVSVLGFDVGYTLVVRRTAPAERDSIPPVRRV